MEDYQGTQINRPSEDFVKSTLDRYEPLWNFRNNPSAPLHVVYTHALHLAPRVRAFADHVPQSLREEWQRLTNLAPAKSP
jgi:hypothetical protein